jgi:hypothetical protein
MAAAVLANATNMCRVIVPSALLNQSAEIMQARLGGLVGRVVQHIYYSRRTSTSQSMLELYASLHANLVEQSGVLITTGDIVLSHQLSARQCLADGLRIEARAMYAHQQWLAQRARDILDESDVTLAVKTQLIYPSGSQVCVDGGSLRWLIPQTLYAMVESHLPTLQARLPDSVRVVGRSNGFPFARFLRSDAEQTLSTMLIEDICEGRFPLMRSVFLDKTCAASAEYPEQLPKVGEDLHSLLTIKKFDNHAFRRILSRSGSEKEAVRMSIFLLRGLLTDGILIVCLKKRWNVDYGLYLERQPMAVPYEAKGVPSEQAEFGHADVAINLTCLSFYHSGMDLSQFENALKLVMSSDDPDSEYERWTSGVSLPPYLSRRSAVNMEDQSQTVQLWNLLRYSRPVLHHYMNHFVFPIHAKQFPVKQQASGWDIPIQRLESQTASTTGFSGTNDNKFLLPYNIQQDDLPSLYSTSAELLSYTLQSRNRHFEVAPDRQGYLHVELLLANFTKSTIRLLIDAGALVLDMSNHEVIDCWLRHDEDARAGVYFDSKNRAWVKYRGRRDVIPLLASPFADNLNGCVVYLDQAHTRGVDLKFPPDAQGAVTLSLGQTKDSTVQGQSFEHHII